MKIRLDRVLAAFCVAASTAPTLITATTPDASPEAAATNLAEEFRANNSFSGVWAVVRNNKTVFDESLSLVDEENHVPMLANNVFPVGSNSKLFAAVALYQLQEQGKVNVSAPVSDYLTQEDMKTFGVANETKYCPRLTDNGPCQNITFTQLLSMSSGLPNAFKHMYPPYKGSIAAYVGLFVRDRMVFAPGSNYSYSNANYILASYLIEKLSNQSLAAYLQQHVFKPLGLRHTYYDPYDGEFSIIPNYASQYLRYLAADTNKQIAVGSCQPYYSSGAMSGAGGLLSTMSDMTRWYTDLFAHRGQKSKLLSPTSIAEIVRPWNLFPMSGQRAPGKLDYFGQGIGVTYATDDHVRSWPLFLRYCGGTACSHTCLKMTFSNKTSDFAIYGAFSNEAHVYVANTSVYDEYRNKRHVSDIEDKDMRVDDGGADAVREALVSLWEK
ncbi:TPA: hypothetical protein N0F65_000092 [Lagenidium giganteum]|uniref:Beta-lactamase-related domain-containing protein n=1 Tax=Lagenidium giganteum TaxID=4803 RepID=A0AAV2YSL7_9STRA|nr:TPA: hypothetical protein N0F65_000092 [Lagenidium giganteum]